MLHSYVKQVRLLGEPNDDTGSRENLAASTTDCDPHTTLANPYRESGDGSRSRPRLEFREITELSG